MTRHFFVRSLLVAGAALLLSACGQPPRDSAYQNRGTPESLLDISSEVVSLNVASPADMADLTTWIGRDQPTRAELNCDANEKYCRDAETLLRKKNVPVTRGTQGAQAVTLVYARVVARDCDQRFRDNVHNFYNTNHAAFGCSVAANMVQHVTDKREFTNPSLLDDPSARGAVNAIRNASAPRPLVKPYKLDDSLVNKAAQSTSQ